MWLFTTPNDHNRIFHAGPSRQMHWIDVRENGATIPDQIRDDAHRMCGSAILYDVGKLLVLGGSTNQDSGVAHKSASIVDFNSSMDVQVESIGDMQFRRVFPSTVLLPSGDVIVAGGQSRTRKWSDLGSVLQAELWSPITKTFRPLASMEVGRTYHSTCILLKDARVACGGGGL